MRNIFFPHYLSGEPQIGQGRGKAPAGRSNPSGEHLGTEASEKDFCLCHGNIVALAGMLPYHEQ